MGPISTTTRVIHSNMYVGPMVYAVAYLPITHKDTLEQLGCDGNPTRYPLSNPLYIHVST
jgi:hypothetical protein